MSNSMQDKIDKQECAYSCNIKKNKDGSYTGTVYNYYDDELASVTSSLDNVASETMHYLLMYSK
jgi:hypothetical protein